MAVQPTWIVKAHQMGGRNPLALVALLLCLASDVAGYR